MDCTTCHLALVACVGLGARLVGALVVLLTVRREPLVAWSSYIQGAVLSERPGLQDVLFSPVAIADVVGAIDRNGKWKCLAMHMAHVHHIYASVRSCYWDRHGEVICGADVCGLYSEERLDEPRRDEEPAAYGHAHARRRRHHLPVGACASSLPVCRTCPRLPPASLTNTNL